MRQVNRTFGVLFVAAASVYAAQAGGRTSAAEAIPGVPAGISELAGPSTQPSGNLFNNSSSAPESTGELIPVDGAKKEGPIQEGQPVKPGQVNISETGTVEIHVVDASVVEVLRMLGAQSQKNIVVSKDVHGPVTANLYDVTMKEALDGILPAYGFAYREKGSFIYVYTTKELAEIEKSTRKPQTEVFRLFYTPAANAVTMIKPVMSTEGQVAVTTPATSGITSGVSDTGGNTHATDDIMVITDYPENLDKIREVLKEVDRRPQQILIEATILRAALTEDNALGVDFTVLGGLDFASITGLGANAGPGVLQGSTLSNPAAGPIIDKGFGGAGTGFTQGVPQGGLRMGFVSNNIGVFIQALESVTDTTVLANPKILALNRQKGEVIVGRKDGYLTTTVTSSSSTQSVEFLDTGTRLIFRPFIGDDGYIRMEIHPEDSSGGLTSNANLPFKITTEVTSNVMIKDGRTIVIGGLFRESSDSSKTQAPFLGNIPIAGYLFRNQRDRTTREEIIILLTPHIIKDDEGYSKESLAAQKDWEKLRVGVRKGMMPFGRERLAEISYENAVTEMNKPNPDRAKALWNLDMATNLNPKFAEAIAMKEKLTGVELQTVDNSSVRGFLRRRVMAESTIAPSTQPAYRRLPEPKPQDDKDSNSPTSTSAISRNEGGPATRPSPQVAVATGPATRPSSEPQPVNGPATRPSEAVAAPHTDSTPAIAAGPATQPAVAVEVLPDAASGPATQPSTSVEELPPK